ncbi:MAG: protein kinase, partial [Micromonosporaceae bacterium]|nr:protein kinase [Micromonosporaceae bacterium]
MDTTSILAGRYRLEQRLGGGGMSVVWRAYDEVLGRRVAVKVVAGQHASEARAHERIRTEVKAAKRVSHPHVTKVLDYSDSAKTPYLVMQLLHGQTLARRMRGGRLPVRTALEICAQVADALAAAHAAGVVHRDIKPGNVMLTAHGATVLDFGIAGFVGERDECGDSPEVAEDRIWGTAAYLAPERLIQRQVLPASDVYALGVLLYRALAGRSPWPTTGRAEMLAAHICVEPTPLPAEAGVPPAVARLCHRCLAKNPQDRPTAREVARVLAAAAAELAAADAAAAHQLSVADADLPAGTAAAQQPSFAGAGTRAGSARRAGTAAALGTAAQSRQARGAAVAGAVRRFHRQLAVAAGVATLLMALCIYAVANAGPRAVSEAAPGGPNTAPHDPPAQVSPPAIRPVPPATPPAGGRRVRGMAVLSQGTSLASKAPTKVDAPSSGKANAPAKVDAPSSGKGNAPAKVDAPSSAKGKGVG